MKNMLLISFLLAAFCCLPSAAQAQHDSSMPQGEAGVDFNVTNEKGRHGLWIRVYPTGKMYYKGQFANGEPTGIFSFFYDSGERMSDVDHLDGTRNMFVVNYYKNGKVLSKGHYTEKTVDGNTEKWKQGAWEFYTEQGVLKTSETYVDNKREGKSIEYFANGKVLSEYSYARDEKHGAYREYFENGRLKGEGSYEYGELNGDYKLYEANGRPFVQGKYIKGAKDGLWIKFNSSGEIELTIKYDKGVETKVVRENGEFTDYFDNGIPASTYTYKERKKHGPFTEWYEQGEFIREPLEEPMPGGGIQFREKLVGTQIKCEGEYVNGVLDGEVTWYNTDGRITKIEHYLAGELQSVDER
ncbi:MAG: putative glucosyltransferase-S [Bacteroidota bacterium]|jgi:antitoxin component YwqK of YwqJK toxin-antitoxin module